MGEQRNLTEENVEELKASLEKMHEENPNLKYRFFEQSEEKLYVGTKLITAVPMDEAAFAAYKNEGGRLLGDQNREGYKVTYPDGYLSWSPKETFEAAYREVTPSERALF